MRRFESRLALLASLAALPAAALATNGYFPHGYGMKNKAMGGASIALAHDSFGGANNPANMAFVDDRFDIGLDWFNPVRSAERRGAPVPSLNGRVESDSENFFIPEFGFVRRLNPQLTFGVTLYGNGGMNTDYNGGQIAGGGVNACGTGAGQFNQASGQAGPYNLLCGAGKLGMNLEQLIIAPTFAKKVNKDNSLGVSLLVARQTFKAEGLSAFYSYTTPGGVLGTPFASGNNLTNRGNDSTWGYGIKLGWMGKVSDTVTLGAAYTSKVRMAKFDKYKDLFAGRGYFDLPESFTLGIAVKTSPKWTIAADYEQISYGGIKSVNNPSTNGGLAIGGTLGCDTCRGFGWKSVNVFKIGAEYQYNQNLILRAGYNHTDNPIQARDVTFNMIAPGVVKDHVTAGFTYNLSKESELTMAYMHAFKNSVSGPSLFNNWLGDNATDKIQMYENSLGIAYSMKLK